MNRSYRKYDVLLWVDPRMTVASGLDNAALRISTQFLIYNINWKHFDTCFDINGKDSEPVYCFLLVIF